MQTPLSGNQYWFLHGLVYQADGLRLILREGLPTESTEPPPDCLNEILEGLVAIDVMRESREFEVRFERLVAWQVVNESFCSLDPYELPDELSPIRILSRSRYLDAVDEAHGWYADVVGPATHYQVCRCDEVIDVVAFRPPTIDRPSRE